MSEETSQEMTGPTAETAEAPRAPVYSDVQLVYARGARCTCGAGMAYPRNIGGSGQWTCSALLTGRASADPRTQEPMLPFVAPGAKGAHTAPLPFSMYEVKSEQQPNHDWNGGEEYATTRPGGLAAYHQAVAVWDAERNAATAAERDRLGRVAWVAASAHYADAAPSGIAGEPLAWEHLNEVDREAYRCIAEGVRNALKGRFV